MSKSFEEALSELEKIIENLESGEFPLEESFECFKKGMELSKLLSSKLDEVERKITVLVENNNGSIDEKELSEV
jgi:exodeoxyribonuclease VII small subunit